MKQGILVLAFNNDKIDYVKQAAFVAKRAKQYLNLPVSIITDCKNIKYDVFDNVILLEPDEVYYTRTYSDGTTKKIPLEFKNSMRNLAYDLTPYIETLLIDTDFIISNSKLLNLFEMNHDFMIYNNAVELSGWRSLDEFMFVSDVGPKFYWATVIFFRKTLENEILFNQVKHVKENYDYYQALYQMNTNLFRNDHAFSIAIHTVHGHVAENSVSIIKEPMFYTTDRDILLDINGDEFLFLIQKENSNDYFPLKIKGSNVHVMNKFSLDKVIDSYV